ncbi:hypothetical protein BANRA_01835 [Klebsiella quasipneumoniae]|nr:hypothetical protein BANRA_01835 [Klebsiella quasipneumoniae]
MALRLPGLQNHLPIRRLLNTPGPASAAGQGQRARSRLCAGWRFAYPAYNAIYLSEGYSTPQVRQAPRRRARTAGAEPLLCRVAATPYPAYNAIYLSEGYSTPQTRQAPPGKDSRRGAACVPGGATLTRPTTPFTYQKATQHPRSGKRRAAGQGQRARCRLCAGWRLRLTRPGVRATCR